MNYDTQIIYQAIGTEPPYVGVMLATSKLVKYNKYKGLSKDEFEKKVKESNWCSFEIKEVNG